MEFLRDWAEYCARLTDLTNSGNGLFVKKFNGPSDGQIATNFTAEGATIHGGAVIDGNVTFANDVTFDTSLNVPTAVISHLTVSDLFASIFTNSGFSFIQNLRCAAFTNVDSATFLGLSASKLAAFDANKVLTNATISESDITGALFNTNLYIRNQNGLGTNTLLISPTNQPSASNQVAMTVNGVAGQTNNLVEWGTNGVRRGRIEAAGHLISDGYVASTNGLINTNIAGHFWRTENLGNGFTWSLDFDGSTMISVNNSANINASSISMNGSTLSDSSRNIKGTSIALGTATALGKAHVTNSTAQISLLIQTIATNSLAQFTTGNTLKAVVETNGFGSYNSSATNAIAASGWTNTSGAQQTALVTATAVSFTVLDRAAATLYTSPTLTATLSIPLQPGWAINAASGLTGTILPW